MMYHILRFVVILLLFTSVVRDAGAQSRDKESFLIEVGLADSLYSDVLQEERQFWIHLPNGGNLIDGQRYPVIYLLDGGVHLGGLAMVQEYYNYFRLPEMIVVGIANRSHRTRDLTPTKVMSRQGSIVDESGESEAFTRFISDELIPFIDAKYPTTEHRTLIGHSYAGLFTVNTLIYHPQLFTNYIALDPSLGWDDEQWLAESLRSVSKSSFSNKGLFVAVANEIIRFSNTLTIDNVSSDTTEFSMGIRSVLTFVNRLGQNTPSGLRFSWKFYEEDIHRSIPLVGMRDGLVFLYDFWELKNPSVYNNPDTPTEDLVSLIRAQSEATTAGMGYPSPMDWELLEMLGRMSLDANQFEKARAVFDISAEYYPNSGDAHASLMEVCVLLEDLECAAKHAQKADELVGGNSYVKELESKKDMQ